MNDCLFCKIAAGEIPSAKVYEDERAVAFRDIAPQAPVHILVIPKEHIESVGAIDESNMELAGYLLSVAAKVAKQESLTGGFRLISNCGSDAKQSVKHLHFHILGGMDMGERIV